MQEISGLARSIYNYTLDSMQRLGAQTTDDDSPILLLGKEYTSLSSQEFLDDWQTRPWITYRSGFPPINPSEYTSDAGWGCMLRSGQMLLANTSFLHHFGRDFRVGDKNTNQQYSKILSLFFDYNSAQYSVHRIALQGIELDIKIGDWFGPSTISQVLSTLSSRAEIGFDITVAMDGVVYRNLVQTPGLVLVPLLLGGGRELNPVYHNAVKSLFNIPQCVGLAGGRPNSSLYFIGCQGDKLLYLDPHHARSVVPLRDYTSYSFEDLSTYQCKDVRSISISLVDPSMVVGFYCKTAKDFEDLGDRLRDGGITSGRTPLFGIEDEPVDFAHEDLSHSESEFEMM